MQVVAILGLFDVALAVLVVFAPRLRAVPRSLIVRVLGTALVVVAFLAGALLIDYLALVAAGVD